MRIINEEMKELIQRVEESLNIFSIAGFDLKLPSPSGNERMTISELFFEDLRDFLLFLSMADGSISNEEAAFLDDYLGYFMTPAQMYRIIESEELLDDDYVKSGQRIIKTLVYMNNLMIDGGMKGNITSFFIVLYEKIGEMFLECDGECSDDELIALDFFIFWMKKYVEDNLKLKEDNINKVD